MLPVPAVGNKVKHVRREILEALPVLAVFQGPILRVLTVFLVLCSLCFAYTTKHGGVRYCGNWQYVGVQYCSYCQYSEVFQGSILFLHRVLPSIPDVCTAHSAACTSGSVQLMVPVLAVFRPSVLLMLPVLSVFRPSVLLMVPILAVFRPLARQYSLYSRYEYSRC